MWYQLNVFLSTNFFHFLLQQSITNPTCLLDCQTIKCLITQHPYCRILIGDSDVSIDNVVLSLGIQYYINAKKNIIPVLKRYLKTDKNVQN